MTEPPFSGNEGADKYPPTPQQPGYVPPGSQYVPPPPGAYPPSGAYPPPVQGGYPGGYPGSYVDPMAPYGRHPLTGEPLSDKSKTVAGLLQLLGIFGFLGIGRMYIGQVGFGVAQLVGCLVLGAVTCGVGFIVPVIWGIVDAVLMFTDKVRDPQGRPLRDGT